MARAITSISEIMHTIPSAKIKVLSFTEEFQKINKVKYNLSLLYFAGLAVVMTSLFL